MAEAHRAALLLVDISAPRWKILFCNTAFAHLIEMEASAITALPFWDQFVTEVSPLLPYFCCVSVHLPLSSHHSAHLCGHLCQELDGNANGGLVAGGLQDAAALPYATGQQQLDNGHDFMTQAQIHSRSMALHMRQVSLLQSFSREASIGCWDNAVPCLSA